MAKTIECVFKEICYWVENCESSHGNIVLLINTHHAQSGRLTNTACSGQRHESGRKIHGPHVKKYLEGETREVHLNDPNLNCRVKLSQDIDSG